MVVGLAFDFCVRQTVRDAVAVGQSLGKQWDIVVVRDGVRGVDQTRDKSVADELEALGVRFIGMEDLDP